MLEANSIPDIEMFVFFKWAVGIGIVSAIGTFASLLVKKWWYGTEKHSRRAEDNQDTRGLLERFFTLKEATNVALVEVKAQLEKILRELQTQSKAFSDAAEIWKCNYESHGRQK